MLRKHLVFIIFKVNTTSYYTLAALYCKILHIVLLLQPTTCFKDELIEKVVFPRAIYMLLCASAITIVPNVQYHHQAIQLQNETPLKSSDNVVETYSKQRDELIMLCLCKPPNYIHCCLHRSKNAWQQNKHLCFFIYGGKSHLEPILELKRLVD